MILLILLQEGVRTRQMVRNDVLSTRGLLHAFARIRIDLTTKTEGKVSGSNHCLGEIRGVLDDRNPGQVVAVPDKVLRDRCPVAAGHAVATDPSFLQVRRVDR